MDTLTGTEDMTATGKKGAIRAGTAGALAATGSGRATAKDTETDCKMAAGSGSELGTPGSGSETGIQTAIVNGPATGGKTGAMRRRATGEIRLHRPDRKQEAEW